jgi:hypothetical protein
MSELRNKLIKIAAEGRIASDEFRKRFPKEWNSILPRPAYVTESSEYKKLLDVTGNVVKAFTTKEAQEEIRLNGPISVEECARYMQTLKIKNA